MYSRLAWDREATRRGFSFQALLHSPGSPAQHARVACSPCHNSLTTANTYTISKLIHHRNHTFVIITSTACDAQVGTWTLCCTTQKEALPAVLEASYTSDTAYADVLQGERWKYVSVPPVELIALSTRSSCRVPWFERAMAL